ncbi:MAG: hypothetical protein GY708_17825 [Actinomycetia bacterium]|nr:hypothetical protein [Actinomycetes bacterium]
MSPNISVIELSGARPSRQRPELALDTVGVNDADMMAPERSPQCDLAWRRDRGGANSEYL